MWYRAALRTVSLLKSVNMRSYTYEQCVGSSRAMAKILNGKELAAELNQELKVEVESWIKKGHKRPKLTCILVGDDPASHTYVRNKMKAAEEIGIEANLRSFEDGVSEAELCDIIMGINDDDTVDGLLVQLPLPDNIDERVVCNAVSRLKDVDGFHVGNVGRMCLDMTALVPATPLGVLEILRRNKVETFGRNAVVVGRSKNVGMPLAMLLHADGTHESGLGRDATVTICHRHTPREQLKLYCQHADIIVSATGIPKLIKADMVKPGATVIDVGISRVQDEVGKMRLCGDVDFEEVCKVAGAVTPVPGGVGPMTVSMLMRNTFQAAKQRAASGHDTL